MMPLISKCTHVGINKMCPITNYKYGIFSVSVLSLSHIFRQKFRRRKWLEVPFGNRSRSSGATHFFPFFFWRLLALKVVSRRCGGAFVSVAKQVFRKEAKYE